MLRTRRHYRARAGRCRAAPSQPALLAQLAAEYPELFWPTVTLALEQAHAAAAALGSIAGDATGGRRLGLLARDRLDVARERANLAARRVGRAQLVARVGGDLRCTPGNLTLTER